MAVFAPMPRASVPPTGAKRTVAQGFPAAVQASPPQPPVEVQVLYPPDLTLTSEGTIRVFAFRPKKGGADNVSVNGISGTPLEGDVFLKGEAKLFTGMNVLQTGGRTIRVFSLPGAKMERFLLPTGREEENLTFQSYRLHPALDQLPGRKRSNVTASKGGAAIGVVQIASVFIKNRPYLQPISQLPASSVKRSITAKTRMRIRPTQ